MLNLNAQEIYKPLPTTLSYDKKKVNLGRELFFDTLLSKNKNISCASCHSIYGADDKKFSLGDNNKIGSINTTSIFNNKFNLSLFWNGRANNLKEQLLDGPLFNEHEMNISKELIEQRLRTSLKYQKLFEEAYGKKPNFKNSIDAIIAFEETLITPNSKFDKYLRGEVEFSSKEKKGLELFNSYGCVSCHNGINLGGNSYQKFGTIINYNSSKNNSLWEDRFKYTNKQKDKDVYRVPSLRNVAKTAPYFHSGDVNDLKHAISLMAYYNLGIVIKHEEVELIELFLNTLTGELPKTWITR
ncbi:cytochrome-c peroxidase [Arcobacter roscoffensis]|uniref:C-type cytochrome n=1 Tax=Arcobacter roscoffensis TaxID=2961520 RepID=A0ABY5E5D0_9BACT|nr:cytochrome c peroxidase [Arcobacter roscoffensis]UTJ07367.1 c-type cytochrome [Arcobacter roscoffensis]